jgi:hypothetical protein
MKTAIACIKTVTAAEVYPNHRAKPSDPSYYMLRLGNNTLMNLTRYRNKFGMCYESDSFSGDKQTIREWKEVIVEKLECGDYGEVLKDVLYKLMRCEVK